jgi:hypothetical protein
MSLPPSVLKQLGAGQGIFSRALTSGHVLHTLDLDCALLPEPKHIPTRKDWPVELKESGMAGIFYNRLPEDHKPCLYRFEIVDGQSREEIFSAYLRFHQNNGGRATAAVKKTIDYNTDTLYVGKVKLRLRGRMVVHTGHYAVGSTAGLQLACWAKGIGLRLRVHVVEFEEEMAPFVSSLELDYSRDFRPLIGKQ